MRITVDFVIGMFYGVSMVMVVWVLSSPPPHGDILLVGLVLAVPLIVKLGDK